ncbi:MAG TPA: PqqD family protein [Longimicrobiales bacterium]|nr:PqqD family protein [Longimicrobiales bacterium]
MTVTLPQPNPAVIFQFVADGAVLLDTRTEVYFGLNNVGARIWGLLPPACVTVEDACAELRGDYPEVDEPTLRADIEELLDELAGHGLVITPVAQGSGEGLRIAGAMERGHQYAGF